MLTSNEMPSHPPADARIDGPADKVTERLSKLETLLNVTYQEPYHLLEFEEGKQPQSKINQVLAKEGWNLLSMEEVEMSLEEIFVKLTKEAEVED